MANLFKNDDDIPHHCPDDRGIYCAAFQLAFRTALDAPFSHLGCHREGGRKGTEQQIMEYRQNMRQGDMSEEVTDDAIAIARANVIGRLLCDFDRIKRLLSQFMSQSVVHARIGELDEVAGNPRLRGGRTNKKNRRSRQPPRNRFGRFKATKKKKKKTKATTVKGRKIPRGAILLSPEPPCAQELSPLNTANNDLEEMLNRDGDVPELPSLLRDLQDPNEYDENAVGLNSNYHMPQI